MLNWYSYGARFYDPILARFHTVDPLAEEYLEWSPYNYVGGNPIKRIDIDGLHWYEDEDGNIVYNEDITSQEYMDDNNIKGTYVAESFLGRDQDDALFSFNADGTYEKSEISATSYTKSFLDEEDQEAAENSLFDITSTLVDDGENNTSEAAFGLAAVLFADDATVVGILDDPVAVGALIVGVWASCQEAKAIYEFAAHRKGKRKSTEGKHTKGEARKAKDKGGEKGDIRRSPPRQRPPKWKGPWPPKN